VEQYNNRPDVVFLSLNMDENPGLIEPFMTEHKLSLTALPAFSYVTQTLKVNDIPQNWIVDASGVIRLKGIGYDATERWEQGMRDAIEKCKPEGAPAAAAGAASSSR
jgi:hypothetical protein